MPRKAPLLFVVLLLVLPAAARAADPPRVVISSPREGQRVTPADLTAGSLSIDGRVIPGTSPDVVRLTVNGRAFTVSGSYTFHGLVRPQAGRFRIVVVATDRAGLVGQATVTINYSTSTGGGGGGPFAVPPTPTRCALKPIPFGRLTSFRVGRITCAAALRVVTGTQRNHGRFCGPGPGGRPWGCRLLGFTCRGRLIGRTQLFGCARGRQGIRWVLRF